MRDRELGRRKRDRAETRILERTARTAWPRWAVRGELLRQSRTRARVRYVACRRAGVARRPEHRLPHHRGRCENGRATPLRGDVRPRKLPLLALSAAGESWR